jgi:hypothetical protein
MDIPAVELAADIVSRFIDLKIAFHGISPFPFFLSLYRIGRIRQLPG